MASSNVQYYEKQRELQNTITHCQQQRVDLERQFQIALKADQTSAKMKASRLNTYWRKICEDERRAKQRNEMLMRDFERISSHMSELNARTQKLALLKKQYEDYISKTYPKWNEFMNSTSQQTELSKDHSQKTVSEHSQHSQIQEVMGKLSTKSHSVAEKTDGSSHNNERTEASGVVNIQQAVKEQQTQKQGQGQQHQSPRAKSNSDNKSYTHQVVSKQTMETDHGGYANLPIAQSNKQKLHQPMQEETGSHSMKAKSKVSAMQPKEVEELSDFWSDSDLPMGQSLGNTQIKVDMRSTSGKTALSSKINGSTKIELSIDGLINLLQLVELDMVNAFSCEDFYRRSSLPVIADQNDIIRKANNNGDLRTVDTSMITMVVLEQISTVLLNLPEKCLLPENLLQNVASLTVPMLRQHLSPEAQVIWDALCAHFIKLVQCDVMKPQELSAVFTPYLVVHGGSLDKAQKFIMNALDGRTINAHKITGHNEINTASPKQTLEGSGSFVEDFKVPPLKFGSLLDKPLSDDESSYINSSLPHDPVPLNETEAYKSMVSISGRGIPHRQLSGHDDTDDDVEKQVASALVKKSVTLSAEKRIAKVDDPSETSSQTLQTTPHVYVPTAMETRHTINSSRVPPSKFQGVKISSDLDTDTEVDTGIFGSSRRPEDNSDFDFYD